MSYRLINANDLNGVISNDDYYKKILNAPCIFADLPNGLDGKLYNLQESEEEIIKLIIENNLEVEVYDILHSIIVAKMENLQDKTDEFNSELKLIKKFADVNKLDVIKDILRED